MFSLILFRYLPFASRIKRSKLLAIFGQKFDAVKKILLLLMINDEHPRESTISMATLQNRIYRHRESIVIFILLPNLVASRKNSPSCT